MRSYTLYFFLKISLNDKNKSTVAETKKSRVMLYFECKSFASLYAITASKDWALKIEHVFVNTSRYVLISQCSQTEIVYLHYHSSSTERSKSQYKYS